MSTEAPAATLGEAATLLAAADALLEPILERTRSLTDSGKAIDEHQVLTERVAYAATQQRAAREVVAFATGVREEGRASEALERGAVAACADLVTNTTESSMKYIEWKTSLKISPSRSLRVSSNEPQAPEIFGHDPEPDD